MIVIVNDNGWSIAENHGGLYRNLAELRESEGKAPCNLFRALGLDYRFLAEGNDEAAVERVLAELRGIRPSGCFAPVHYQGCRLRARRGRLRELAPCGPL